MGRRPRAKKNIIYRCISTRKETERNTETRRKDSCERDMESVGLKEEEVLDRTTWKNDTRNYFGDTR